MLLIIFMTSLTQPLIGQILKLLRVTKGIKQDTIAKNAGFCQQYYSQIESGKNISEEKYNHILNSNNYTAEEIEKISKFLPLPPSGNL